MSATPVAVQSPPATRPAALRIAEWRDALKRGRAALRDAFFSRPDTGALLRAHTRLIDRIVLGA
jgi:hypothetical protein